MEICRKCGVKVNVETDLRNELSRKEFAISGLCQNCQDDFFGKWRQFCYNDLSIKELNLMLQAVIKTLQQYCNRSVLNKCPLCAYSKSLCSRCPHKLINNILCVEWKKYNLSDEFPYSRYILWGEQKCIDRLKSWIDIIEKRIKELEYLKEMNDGM